LKESRTSRSLLNAWGIFKKTAKDYPTETEHLLLALGEYLRSGENVTSLIRAVNLYARILAETHPTIEWWSVANQLAERDVFSHLSEVILSVLEKKDEFSAYREGYQLFLELVRTGALADSLKLFAKYAKASHKVTGSNQ
ncbi:MAG: hypothetical protein HY391_05875, partial [Deltaproteobacteria bacterium]|nr:hypothetical protein [Deltaproteobacteria bacterium]